MLMDREPCCAAGRGSWDLNELVAFKLLDLVERLDFCQSTTEEQSVETGNIYSEAKYNLSNKYTP